MAKHLVLLGMMGCGKSTVGAYLESVLNRVFYDVDRVIEEQEKQSISEIFATRGEASFRKLEARTIERLLDRQPGIISLGGGAFIQKKIRDVLLIRALTIYLRARPASLVVRVGNPATRPLLANTDVLATLTALLKKREPIYSKAHCAIETDGLSVSQVGDTIWNLREKFESAEPGRGDLRHLIRTRF